MTMMKKTYFKKRRKKRGPVVANKVKYDGIQFASGLEKYMYIALRKAKIQTKYEGQTYNTFDGCNMENECYERQSNGKGEFINRGNKKILGIKYTPDFIGTDYIIECKGRPNESFPMRWKLFKKYVAENLPNVTLYKPQNQKECEKVIEIILAKRKQ
jgi:hypothetical protein